MQADASINSYESILVLNSGDFFHAKVYCSFFEKNTYVKVFRIWKRIIQEINVIELK